MAKGKHGFINEMEFNKKVNDYARKTLRGEKKMVFLRMLAMHLLRGVVFKTPVDTGRARGGWQVNIGGITGDEGGENKGGYRTLMKGLAVIEQWVSMGATGILFIFNNVPYIVDLENGHSGQAPHGMLKVTFAEIAGSLGMM